MDYNGSINSVDSLINFQTYEICNQIEHISD